MIDMIKRFGCVKYYTVIRSGCEKRIWPGVLQAGIIEGRQVRYGFVSFDTGRADDPEPQAACLRIFVRRARLCRHCETICVRPVLPCGTPLPTDEKVVLEVGRGFSGWLTVDVLPLYQVARRELGDAPFCLMLSAVAPSLVVFSTDPGTQPRLVVEEQRCCKPEPPKGTCTGALDVCAPFLYGCCLSRGSGIRVENGQWEIQFEGEDSSVVQRVDRMKQGTFFVTNTGESGLRAMMETGYDGEKWAYDTQKCIAPGETQAIVAKFYGRYYRMTLTAEGQGQASVVFIGQYYA